MKFFKGLIKLIGLPLIFIIFFLIVLPTVFIGGIFALIDLCWNCIPEKYVDIAFIGFEFINWWFNW